jgi:nucleoside-diphosphate-sugar epimerase
MKVLVAGATGAIGTPLCRRLNEAGHEVIGITQTTSSASRLERQGIRPVVADALNRKQLLDALREVRADVVIHELTALRKPPARHSGMARTNELRTVGTSNLVTAARQVGATRFLTQSIVFGYGYVDHRKQILTESTSFCGANSGRCNPHVAAMQANEKMVRGSEDFEGIALRYGIFYGADVSGMRDMLNARKIPVPSRVHNPLPWIHIEDAAAATVAAVENGRPGAAYNIADNGTASWGQMFSDMAVALKAPQPRVLPAWMIRMAAPYVASMILDTSMRVSTNKAHTELGWAPMYPTRKEGLEALAAAAAAA